MKEMWREINDYPNYSVSNNGQIMNNSTGEIKAQRVKKGYSFVDLYNNGERRSCRVHRLVGDAFLEKNENCDYINHKNGNKLDNNIENLEWVTQSENCLHAYRTGLREPSRGMLGKHNPNAGRHGRKVMIVETGEIFDSIMDCEKAIDGNNRHISDCLHGRQITHRGYHFQYVE